MPRIGIEDEGTPKSTKRTINFVEGENVTITVTDPGGHDAVDVEIAAAAGGSFEGDASDVPIIDAADDFTATDVEGALAELQSDAETHAAAADPHTGYRLESADHTHQTTGAQAGELGGTWASPTVDATHAGSTHSAATDTHIADAADAHDASAISVDSTTLVGTGTDVQASLEELDNGIADHLADAAGAHAASAISFTPNGSIASTDVQAAIQEVRDEAGGGSVATDTIFDAAGDLVQGTGSNTSARLAIGTNLTHRLVPVSGSAAWALHVVRKTADETVNNSDVLQNDDHLAFAIGASEIWFFEAKLLITSGGTGSDLKFGFTVPASCTMLWGATGTPSNNLGGFGATTSAASPAAIITESGTLTQGSAAVTFGSGIAGFVTNSTNAGTVQFQWAQNSATAHDTKLLTNSLFLLWRLA
jgi:hypothetical protein